MKKLIVSAILLAFLPSAQAADKSEFSHNAEYRIRYQVDQNWGGDKDTNTTLQGANHRFKLGNTFKASDKFSAHLSLIYAAMLGGDGSINGVNQTTGADVTVGANPDSSTPAGIGNALLVNEAYGSWMLSDSWMLRFGRGGFTMGDGAVISQNDWENTPNAFEGVLASYDHEMARFNIYAVKAEDGMIATNKNNDPETNFLGVSVDVKNLPEMLKNVNLFYVQVNADEADRNPDPTVTLAQSQHTARYGLSLNGDIAGVDYKLGYAVHTGDGVSGGTDFDVDQSLMYAEVGYKMAEMMNSRFSFAYHQDSGDSTPADTKDKTYDAFFYEKHGAAGLMDVLAWGNLTFMKVAYDFEPMDNTKVGLAYWMFSKTEKADDVSTGNNGDGVSSADDTKDDIGTEIDVMASHMYDGGFTISAWVGMFSPGGALKTATPPFEDTYNQFFVEGKMSF